MVAPLSADIRAWGAGIRQKACALPSGDGSGLDEDGAKDHAKEGNGKLHIRFDQWFTDLFAFVDKCEL